MNLDRSSASTPPAGNPFHPLRAQTDMAKSYCVRFEHSPELHSPEVQLGAGAPAFTLRMRDPKQMDWLLHTSRYRAALAYIRGQYGIEGDLVEAIRFKSSTPAPTDWLWGLLATLSPSRWLAGKGRAARNIRFHYDRSNEFYQLFLDSNMVYSCACFTGAEVSLDEAQKTKLDLICRKLQLQPEETFLDVGCGWGALVRHAASRYRAQAEGFTLSPSQRDYALQRIERDGLAGRARIALQDYRQWRGRYRKIASVGMFEHVGRRRLPEYFRRMHELLEDGGLFLNHGIIRPQDVHDGAETLFLQRYVFPGGELVPLAEVIRVAEEAGFEVLDVENLRLHYALTCRHWVRRLQQRAEECRRLVDEQTCRVWLLYLAGCALSFETGQTDIHQVLLAKRDPVRRFRVDRSLWYGPSRQAAQGAVTASNGSAS